MTPEEKERRAKLFFEANPKKRLEMFLSCFKKFIVYETPENKISGCWLWLGSTDSDGYSNMRWGDPTNGGRDMGVEKAYRVTWSIVHGPTPEGVEVDHMCQNPRCINPLKHTQACPSNLNKELVKHRELEDRCMSNEDYRAKLVRIKETIELCSKTIEERKLQGSLKPRELQRLKKLIEGIEAIDRGERIPGSSYLRDELTMSKHRIDKAMEEFRKTLEVSNPQSPEDFETLTYPEKA